MLRVVCSKNIGSIGALLVILRPARRNACSAAGVVRLLSMGSLDKIRSICLHAILGALWNFQNGQEHAQVPSAFMETTYSASEVMLVTCQRAMYCALGFSFVTILFLPFISSNHCFTSALMAASIVCIVFGKILCFFILFPPSVVCIPQGARRAIIGDAHSPPGSP